MGCDPVTYHNITPDVFNCLKKKLKDAGINVPDGNEGDIEGNTPLGKIKGHFKWDGVSTLTITITSKPFVISCGTIRDKMNKAVSDCGGKSLEGTMKDSSLKSVTTMPEKIYKISQPIEIELRSIVASTGYMCALVHKPDDILLDGEATHFVPGRIPGQPGKMIFTFIGVAECKGELVFTHVRPWDLTDIADVVIYPIVCQK